eukprot:5828605-Amphidinium_carterae.2
MQVGAPPAKSGVSVTTSRITVKEQSSKKSKTLDTDGAQEELYRRDIKMIEKDYNYVGGEGSRRRKTKKDDQSQRKDVQDRRTNGW